MPRDSGGVSDITGGLPRVTEIFEARKPKDPAIIAEVDGEVEILPEKKRGKTTVIVRSESGIEREHLIPTGKHFWCTPETSSKPASRLWKARSFPTISFGVR